MSATDSTIIFQPTLHRGAVFHAPLVPAPSAPSTRPAPTTNWEPILTGSLGREARFAVAEIAAALPRPVVQPGVGPSLGGGHAGMALFYAYLTQLHDSTHHQLLAVDHLARAMAPLGRPSMDPGLYEGTAGVAWTLAHLSSPADRTGDDQFAMIDEELGPLVAHPSADAEYDLISGLVGIGVYAAERLPSPTAAACLDRIVAHLDRSASNMRRGVTWFTPAARLEPWQRELSLTGHINLGVAHGVPGIIGLLSLTLAHGIAVPQSRRLLAGAVEVLLSQRLADSVADGGGSGSGSFGYTGGLNVDSRPARLAWCYGDLGVATVLLSAATAAGNEAWRREALRLARGAATRTISDSGVRDAALCHGAAGVAHLFNRLYQSTGDGVLADAARRWFAETLAHRQQGRGVGGFAAWRHHGAGGEWADEPGFLEGAAGVGLALLGAVTTDEPQWDRVLLASASPTQA